MSIVIRRVRSVEITDFVKQFNLRLEINERDAKTLAAIKSKDRFWASIEGCEIKGDGVLIGTHGNGETPDEAVKDYAERISHETLVFNALDKNNRREMVCPKLVHTIKVEDIAAEGVAE